MEQEITRRKEYQRCIKEGLTTPSENHLELVIRRLTSSLTCIQQIHMETKYTLTLSSCDLVE